MDELLELAAKLLPEGWQIRIDAERNAASVTLIDPAGKETDMHIDRAPLSFQFKGAIVAAQILDAESKNPK